MGDEVRLPARRSCGRDGSGVDDAQTCNSAAKTLKTQCSRKGEMAANRMAEQNDGTARDKLHDLRRKKLDKGFCCKSSVDIGFPGWIAQRDEAISIR